MSRNPIDDQLEVNLYSYVNNMAINDVDFDGLIRNFIRNRDCDAEYERCKDRVKRSYDIFDDFMKDLANKGEQWCDDFGDWCRRELERATQDADQYFDSLFTDPDYQRRQADTVCGFAERFLRAAVTTADHVWRVSSTWHRAKANAACRAQKWACEGGQWLEERLPSLPRFRWRRLRRIPEFPRFPIPRI